MDGLYPYVHRRRKSLIVEDTPPAKVAAAKVPEGGQQTAPADKPKLNDGESHCGRAPEPTADTLKSCHGKDSSQPEIE
jgi:hypothetical protein